MNTVGVMILGAVIYKHRDRVWRYVHYPLDGLVIKELFVDDVLEPSGNTPKGYSSWRTVEYVPASS